MSSSSRLAQPAHVPSQAAARGGFRLTYLIFVGALLTLAACALYAKYTAHRAFEAQMPRPALETLVSALRTFHQQTGRFPQDFRELDERIWKGTKQERISPDGISLNSPSGNYYYTLHTVPAQTRAGVWAVPTGARAEEAATYFWYVTPTQIEKWMGPALTSENVGAVRSVPSEQQLALLAMTRQRANAAPEERQSSGIFSIFRLLE